MRVRTLAALAAMTAATAPLGAQTPTVGLPPAVDSAVHRIFGSATYFGERTAPARWRDDGVHYTQVERSSAVPGGVDIVQYDAATGAHSVFVFAFVLLFAFVVRPLRVEG